MFGIAALFYLVAHVIAWFVGAILGAVAADRFVTWVTER